QPVEPDFEGRIGDDPERRLSGIERRGLRLLRRRSLPIQKLVRDHSHGGVVNRLACNQCEQLRRYVPDVRGRLPVVSSVHGLGMRCRSHFRIAAASLVVMIHVLPCGTARFAHRRVHFPCMASRYRTLAIYSLLLAVGTGAWLARGLATAPAFPPAWVVILCVLACLFVWQFGLPAPRVGLMSLERVPQIGLLLVLSTPVAASICALASFLWPLLNRAYSQGSFKVAVLRAIHNPAMTALMLLAAGYAYQAVGGRHPLDSITAGDVVPLVVMALVAQVVNIVLMALFFYFDG